jgi:putative DNA primase/helicase
VSTKTDNFHLTNKKHANLLFREGGIYAVGCDQSPTIIADPIIVTAFASSDQGTQGERAFTQIKFRNRHGEWRKEIIPASMLTAGSRDFISLLSNLGYIWPTNNRLWSRIISALSVERPERQIRVAFLPGWHGEFFALPNESYGPKGRDRKTFQIVHHHGVGLGDFLCSGTLDQWKALVAKPCRQSTRARLAIAANFAAPNLKILGLNSFGFNFSGATSGGKTLLLRVACSACGLNREGNPASWDGTAAALEQRAQGHRNCIMPLDDIGYLTDNPKHTVKLIAFRVAGNRAKDKAGQYIVQQNLLDADSQVIALSTSEDSLWSHLKKEGRRCIRGEEVRMIDIPACRSELSDIFDGPNAIEMVGSTVEQRRAFVEKLERSAERHQGAAFREYLDQRVKDKGAKSALERYMTKYIGAAPLPDQHRGLARIQRLFAAIYAGAVQAIDYGVLPWRRRETLAAIRTCMFDAMAQLTGICGNANGPTVGVSDQARLAEFKQRVESADFARLNSSKERIEKAHGVVRPTSPGKVQYLLFGRTFDAWYPGVAARRRLAALLRYQGIFREGPRPDTNTRQFHIAAIGRRVPCYLLRRKRLRDCY